MPLHVQLIKCPRFRYLSLQRSTAFTGGARISPTIPCPLLPASRLGAQNDGRKVSYVGEEPS